MELIVDFCLRCAGVMKNSWMNRSIADSYWRFAYNKKWLRIVKGDLLVTLSIANSYWRSSYEQFE